MPNGAMPRAVTGRIIQSTFSEAHDINDTNDVVGFFIAPNSAGTNGEIALGNKEWLVCCSSSAGPAFEGGGVAQGIGNSYYEHLMYDENAQLVNASFMDYLLPTALDVPPIIVGHEETPSPLNPLGVKGAGEAGAIPTAALFAQAVENALPEIPLELLEIPLSPNRLWELIQEADRPAAAPKV